MITLKTDNYFLRIKTNLGETGKGSAIFLHYIHSGVFLPFPIYAVHYPSFRFWLTGCFGSFG